MIENAICENVHIGLESHGIPTIFIEFKLKECTHISWGGMYLNKQDLFVNIVRELCAIFEVDNLYDCKNKVVRLETTYNKVIRIGHPIKEKWTTVIE